MKYHLDLSPTQMALVDQALEMAARLEAGQFKIALEHLVHRMRVVAGDGQWNADLIETEIDRIANTMTSLLKLSHADPRPANWFLLHEATRHAMWKCRPEAEQEATKGMVDAYPPMVLYSCQEVPPHIHISYDLADEGIPTPGVGESMAIGYGTGHVQEILLGAKPKGMLQEAVDQTVVVSKAAIARQIAFWENYSSMNEPAQDRANDDRLRNLEELRQLIR